MKQISLRLAVHYFGRNMLHNKGANNMVLKVLIERPAGANNMVLEYYV